MLNKIRNALYKFMYGRNGSDQLSQFLVFASIIFLIPTYFIKSNVKLIFMGLFWLTVIYSYFRVFSKNIYKRQAENTKFINKKNYLIKRAKEFKQYKYYNCPKCKTHIRLPRGVGNVTITCKKCGHQFDGKA